MRKYTIIALAILSGFALSCRKDEVLPEMPETENVSFDISSRPMVQKDFCPSIGKPETNLTAQTVGSGALKLTWSANEKLSVFILNAEETAVRYAGEISSSGAAGEGSRNFSGTVAEKASGEKYILVWPSSLNSTSAQRTGDAPLPEGATAKSEISWTGQTGANDSFSHIFDNGLAPVVWREKSNERGFEPSSHQAYIMKICLQFNENPGTITSVTVRTMARGAEDKVFPVSFKASNLKDSVNSTLPAVNTEGITLGSDYSSVLTFTPSTPFAPVDNEAVVYLAVGSVKNLDVFNSKYRVEAVCSNGKTYRSAYISFPKQGSTDVQAAKHLDMSDKAMPNGTINSMKRALSGCYVPVTINTEYRVNSLVGMWDQYGKLYDNENMVKVIDNTMPAALFDLLGTSDKQSSFNARYRSSLHGGSPTFTYNLYESHCASESDHKQKDVTFNNIEITAKTKVYLTFVSEYAWSQNLLGYYHYPTGDTPAASADIDKNFIFPNVSKPGHEPFAKGMTGHNDANNIASAENAPVQEYQTVQLVYKNVVNGKTFYSEEFPAGTTIGFMMIRDPKASSLTYDSAGNILGYNPRGEQGTILDWTAWKFFTNTLWNESNSGFGTPVRYNNFASGDICKLDNGSNYSDGTGKIKGLAIYGGRDDISNNNTHAYSAMIFMVSTSDPEAMKTYNNAALNVGTGSLVVNKTGRMVTYNLGDGIKSSSNQAVVSSGENYSTTLSVSHKDLGGLKDVKVLVGGEDKTSVVFTESTGKIEVPSTIPGDIKISAVTQKVVKAVSLSYADLSSVTSDKKVVLHANTEAFGFKDGNCIQLPAASSPLNNGNPLLQDSDITASYFDIVDYIWTMTKIESEYKFMNSANLYLHKSANTVSGYPIVEAASEASLFTFDTVDEYTFKIKTSDDSFNYMTSRLGASNSTPIFFTGSVGHTDNFGRWRIYRITIEDRSNQ